MSKGSNKSPQTEVRKLGKFVVDADHRSMSESAREELKKRLLDTIGVAIGAIESPVIKKLNTHINEFGGAPLSTMIGGQKTAPDRAALYNVALSRYLDFMDSYLAKGETCHPSDNIGAIMAAAEHADAPGADLLSAIAVAYQVHARLSDVAPVRDKGFDHTVQGAYASAAGVAKALSLSAEQTAMAVAISGTSNNALRVTRTGNLSHWKGLAYPNTAFIGTHAAYLARQGITGPEAVFEGNKGFKQSIAGNFDIDWSNEDLERVKRTIIKKYNAEIHSQSVIEGALELKELHKIDPANIEAIDIEIFDVAFNIIGGGEEGDKTIVATKEQADHSLQYMVGAALLDGQVLPEQYDQDRIERSDIQSLLKRFIVRPNDAYSQSFPDQMRAHLSVYLKDRTVLEISKTDYEGFHTRPMSWGTVEDKFHKLATPHTSSAARDRIINEVRDIEAGSTRQLMAVLSDLKS